MLDVMAACPATFPVSAKEYAMEPPDQTIGYRLRLDLPTIWLGLDASVAAARPPFEWMGEITWQDESGLGHYLIRSDDVVKAERKNLTVLDDATITPLLKKLNVIRELLREAGHYQPGATPMVL